MITEITKKQYTALKKAKKEMIALKRKVDFLILEGKDKKYYKNDRSDEQGIDEMFDLAEKINQEMHKKSKSNQLTLF